jgi:hypothetical protein
MMGHPLEWLDPEDIAYKMANARSIARESEIREKDILIPRRGGPWNGSPYKCYQSVYNGLYEGQSCTALCLFQKVVRADLYRLQKDNAGKWELVWIKSYNV